MYFSIIWFLLLFFCRFLMVSKGSNLFMPPIRNSLEPIKYGSKDKMIQIRGLENYRVRVRDSENDLLELDSDSEPEDPEQ